MNGQPSATTDARPDLGARILEWGLVAVVLAAPLPFGAVPAGGRLALEIAACVLVVVWAIRAMFQPTVLPSKLALIGVLGLLGLAAFQAAPLGATIVGALSPNSVEIRARSSPGSEILAAEERMLGVNPADLDRRATLSVDPIATGSALRTGAALIGLFLVACTVARCCGVRRLALGTLLSAALQGLYGLLVLTSDTPYIWHLPKKYYLESATGTFVNRNHFACFIAMCTACGAALIISNLRHTNRGQRRKPLLVLFDRQNSRNMLLGLALILGLAGLMTSLSRAGIALGVAALLLTIVSTARNRSLKLRFVVALLILAAAAAPLIQLGTDRLTTRFGRSASDLAHEGGRGTVWIDTLSMVQAFPVAGSGYGTFAFAYPVFRSPHVRLFYAHAHNDPLQAAAEGGLIGSLFLVLLLIPTVRNVVRSLTGAKGLLAVGFAAGLAAFLLHGLVDFNAHIPANAAMAAILAGSLEGLPWVDAGSKRSTRPTQRNLQ